MTEKTNELPEGPEDLSTEILESNFFRIFTFLYGSAEPPKTVLDQARYFFFGGVSAAFGSESFNKTVDMMEEVINDAEVRSQVLRPN